MMYQKDFVATIKSNGKILREDGNTVYIPFGSEYSIYMKNLRSQRAVVKISIDGQNVTSDGLVLRGNQSVDLERFLDDNLSNGNRFKFIQKTAKIQEHRGDHIDDGIVRIEFQYEKPAAVKDGYMIYTGNYGLRGMGTGMTTDQFAVNNVYGKSVSSYADNAVTCSCTTDVASYVSQSNVDYLNNAPKVEEGITVPGSISNQQFGTTTVGALETDSYVITLMLKGITISGTEIQQPVTVKTKKECQTCGTSNKATASYCSDCGTYLK